MVTGRRGRTAGPDGGANEILARSTAPETEWSVEI